MPWSMPAPSSPIFSSPPSSFRLSDAAPLGGCAAICVSCDVARCCLATFPRLGKACARPACKKPRKTRLRALETKVSLGVLREQIYRADLIFDYRVYGSPGPHNKLRVGPTMPAAAASSDRGE